MNWPKISIVTPSFNQARFLEATIRSIHDQGYPNLEHIIIDGGSSDESVNIIRKYSSQLHYWVSEPDKGQTDALIKGFSYATGDILAWLNSDDLYTENTLYYVAKHFLAHPEDKFVYGNCAWINENDMLLYERKEIPFIKWIWLYAYNYIPQPSSFWRRSLYECVGGLDPSFLVSMDGDLFARFSRLTHFCHTPKTFAKFRFYPSQRNQKLRVESLQEDNRIIYREMGRKPSNLEKKVMNLVARGTHWGLRKIVQWQ